MLSRLFRRGSRSPVGRGPRPGSRFRPALEALGDRWLPATLAVTNANDGGPGSFRQAILDADNNPGPDTITFAVPGAGVHTISPSTELPPVTDPVVIDGYTQPGAAPATATSPAT